MLNVRKRWKVLMVYPKFPESYWGFGEAVRLLGKRAMMPPTGLATVAAMLPTEHFVVLPIIDLNVEPLLDQQIERADIVMLSAMIVQQNSLRRVITRAKSFGKSVVVGGPYATSYRDEVLAMGADHLVLDEAEVTLAPFAEDWLASRAERVYDEHTVHGRITVSLTKKEGKPVLTNTPPPRWDLLKLEHYSSLALQFSRGCPYHCDFCDIITLYGHEPRAKTSEQMIAEIEAVYQTGWRGPLFIVDDNFIGNRNEVRKLLPTLTRWQKAHHYPFSLFTEASVDLATKTLRDILEGMKEAGFDQVFCGIESTDPKVLAEMDKGQNQGDLGEKVRILQRAGLEVTAGFIIGNDSDRLTVFDELFEFIQTNGIVMAMAGLLAALRRTQLWDRLKQEGRLRGDTSGNNTHQFGFNFETKLDERFLLDGYIGLLERLYLSKKNYFVRCLALRARRGPYRRTKSLNRHEFLATMRVFYRNLCQRPNWQFAKFMVETLLTAPAELPDAIAHAVKYEHFNRLTRETIAAYRFPRQVATLAERFQAQVVLLQGDVEKRLRQLAKLERRFTTEARRLCYSIPRDFRANAEEAFERCSREFRDWVNRQRQALLGPTLAT